MKKLTWENIGKESSVIIRQRAIVNFGESATVIFTLAASGAAVSMSISWIYYRVDGVDHQSQFEFETIEQAKIFAQMTVEVGV